MYLTKIVPRLKKLPKSVDKIQSINYNIFSYLKLTIKKQRRDAMMPLTLANVGEANTIKKIGGKPEVKQHLETL